jgi:hypothetical protein
MLTRLNNGNYIDLSVIISIEVRTVKRYSKDGGSGFMAMGITPSMREVAITDFFHDKDQCQKELDNIINGYKEKVNNEQ